MKTVTATEERMMIDTYPEAPREELPMFAKNRVHQRTSGDPYPNKVVLEAQRSVREKREYTVIRLENEFLEIAVLPELGGKIWYARDKRKGYDFFYRNNVVKPALIGVLGSWTSGGLEFNWPFHHRASTFMPVDYVLERGEDCVTVWLSEHDPIDRMKGMVGIRLRAGECVFETCVKLDNTSSVRRSFLWWENAAVPVNESYSIFFPEDVNYVRFHYKRSVTPYPIADNRFGAYNGILYDQPTDISQHKNTRQATSYFSAESQFDFFGGYDASKDAGVVHAADHHISPGKKLFTWAYGQLAKTWENALTDSDGQYAELMAGCYSDNQPDFSWLEPFETKTFSQFWYPIHGCGKPVVANPYGALFCKDGTLYYQSVRPIAGAVLTLRGANGERSERVDLPAYETVALSQADGVCEISLRTDSGTLLSHTFGMKYDREIPAPRKELPYFKQVKTAEELYLEGLHMVQYRSPEYRGESCWEEALLRDPDYSPALLALAQSYLEDFRYDDALKMTERAEKSLTRFNSRPESGRLRYLKGLILLGKEDYSGAYDAFSAAAWNSDAVCPACFHLGLLDLRAKEYAAAEAHFRRSLNANALCVTAAAYLGYAQYLSGKRGEADKTLSQALAGDPLNLYARLFRALIGGDCASAAKEWKTDATQTVLDLSEYLLEAGLYRETVSLIDGAAAVAPLGAMAYYVRHALTGEGGGTDREGIAFPSRAFELAILKKAVSENAEDKTAHYLLGCLLYDKNRADEASREFFAAASAGDFRAWRNLAALSYTAYGDIPRARKYLKEALNCAPVGEKQLEFECAYFMAKTGEDAAKIAEYLEKSGYDRDDLTVELARAYNRAGKPEKAIETLLSRQFVACEGGEHYIADEYMYAWYLIGAERYGRGDYEGAREAFVSAQTLPQSLGSGLWNEVKLVPYRYFEAACLLRLGKREQAEEIYRSFLRYRFDYFSDMYLITLAYYVGRAYEELGMKENGDSLVRGRLEEFEAEWDKEDTGYFGTTPFFLAFVDAPSAARHAHYAYPLMMFSRYLNDGKRTEKYQSECSKDTYHSLLRDFTR